MRISSLPWLYCLLAGSLSAAGQNTVYNFEIKPRAAHVSILAISTSVHQTYAGNQDVYLADVSFKKEAPQLARLVDIYFLSNSPIRRQLLVDRHLLWTKLTRDQECDMSGNKFFLGSEANIFDPDSRRMLKDRAIDMIPCYRVDHDSTRIAK